MNHKHHLTIGIHIPLNLHIQGKPIRFGHQEMEYRHTSWTKLSICSSQQNLCNNDSGEQDGPCNVTLLPYMAEKRAASTYS